MFTILGGLISAAFNSIGTSNRKKAYDNTTLSKGLFKMYAQFIGFFILMALVYINGFDTGIFNDYKYLFVILCAISLGVFNSLLYLKILKNTKLSQLLPYDNLDKLFIIGIGFFLFYGTEKGVSLITLLITILTLVLIIFFTIDIKNIKLPKNILLLLVNKVLHAIKVIIIGFILIEYSSITYASVNWVYEILIYFTIIFFTGDSLKNLVKQNKAFYINRTTASLLGRSARIIGLIIIKEAGIVVATLIGFLGLAFNIFSMKIILKDSPTKKQIFLAFAVIFLIGIGYSFK